MSDKFRALRPRPDKAHVALQHIKKLKYNEFSVAPDFEDIIGDVIKAFDEPFADDSVVPSYYISELTAKNVKVALSGLGGDELFAGYHRYYGLLVSKLYDYVPSFLHKYIILPLVNSSPEPKNATDKINHIKRFLKYAGIPAANRYLGSDNGRNCYMCFLSKLLA